MTPEELSSLKKGDTVFDLDAKPRTIKGVPSGKGWRPGWRVSSRYGSYELKGESIMLRMFFLREQDAPITEEPANA